jgi:hypothetical protein
MVRPQPQTGCGRLVTLNDRRLGDKPFLDYRKYLHDVEVDEQRATGRVFMAFDIPALRKGYLANQR